MVLRACRNAKFFVNERPTGLLIFKNKLQIEVMVDSL